MRYIIDVHTHGKRAIINRLKRLKWIKSVEDRGPYWADTVYSQLEVESTKNADEIEDWLYDYCPKGSGYVGVTRA